MVARGLGEGAEENYTGNMKELFGGNGTLEVMQLYVLVELIGLYILKSIFY